MRGELVRAGAGVGGVERGGVNSTVSTHTHTHIYNYWVERAPLTRFLRRSFTKPSHPPPEDPLPLLHP